MEQNNGDLLITPDEVSKMRRWTFFDKLEITFVEKQTSHNE